MSKSKSPNVNTIFDHYEVSVKTCQDILKALKENGEYIDNNEGNPVVRSSEGAFMVIHEINRISMIPAGNSKTFFLNGAHISKDGTVVYTSNCHGGIMKRRKYVKNMINNFNKHMKCDGLKIKTILTQDGAIIRVDKTSISK